MLLILEPTSLKAEDSLIDSYLDRVLNSAPDRPPLQGYFTTSLPTAGLLFFLVRFTAKSIVPLAFALVYENFNFLIPLILDMANHRIDFSQRNQTKLKYKEDCTYFVINHYQNNS